MQNKTFTTRAKAIVAGGAAAVAAGAANAGALADAITAGLDSAELMLIGAGVLTLTGIVVLIKKSGRAAGG
ncbi:hypothetical protein [Marilutibacter chinensis]|uniref:Uncharacterized protein n=1 Tax=Marilutibacter chinensis TaxID=2912247 RepID=A0ABS9HQ29_9GAMM|nr:hypothetical protein [Lysobacter chinensis]MCF7220398.1 hypothetical protein [Lysobacter chinensis]